MVHAQHTVCLFDCKKKNPPFHRPIFVLNYYEVFCNVEKTTVAMKHKLFALEPAWR